MNESEEAAAIQRCKTGDKEAFRTLAEQYEKMLFGIAYLMTRDRDQAADTEVARVFGEEQRQGAVAGDKAKRVYRFRHPQSR